MLLRNARQLEGHALRARDGLIGKVTDFYFDDAYWRVRYCVVETGESLDSRRVLISPQAMGAYDPKLDTFPVDLTIQQVRHSPDIGTESLLSRPQEEAVHRYYGWPAYWGGLFSDAPIMPALVPTPETAILGETPMADGEQRPSNKADPFLRSMNDTVGYHIDATDGTIGHVEDFLVHAEDWSVRYLVVDTRHGWPGRRVVLAPEWIGQVNWEKSRVTVDLTRATIDGSPTYDPAVPWTDYDIRLTAYYRGRLTQAHR